MRLVLNNLHLPGQLVFRKKEFVRVINDVNVVSHALTQCL